MIYAVTFQIKDDDSRDERLQSVAATVRQQALGVWEEINSVMVIESNKTTDELTQAIYLDSKFDGSKDSLVVIGLSYQHYVARGVIEQPAALAQLMARR